MDAVTRFAPEKIIFKLSYWRIFGKYAFLKFSEKKDNEKSKIVFILINYRSKISLRKNI